jgi:hypothetical protein
LPQAGAELAALRVWDRRPAAPVGSSSRPLGTLFGIFLTPVFFYVLQWLRGGRGTGRPAPAPGTPQRGPLQGTEIMVVKSAGV